MTSLVQAKGSQTGTGLSTSVTLGATPAPGNLLLCAVTIGGSIASPNYPWGVAPIASNVGAQIALISMWIAGPSEPTTVAFSNSSSRRMSISVIEVAPTAGKVWNSLDKPAVSSTSSGSTVTSLASGATATLDEADDIAFATIALSSTPGGAGGSWSDGYTTVLGADATTGGFAGYKVLSSTAPTSTTGTWTTARAAVGLLAVFKQTTSAVVRTGTATLVLNATATAREVEKRTGTATLVLSATASRKIALRRPGAASLTLTATATARVALARTGLAEMVLTATAETTVSLTRTGFATFILNGSATIPVIARDVTVLSVREVVRPFMIDERIRPVTIRAVPRSIRIEERP